MTRSISILMVCVIVVTGMLVEVPASYGGWFNWGSWIPGSCSSTRPQNQQVTVGTCLVTLPPPEGEENFPVRKSPGLVLWKHHGQQVFSTRFADVLGNFGLSDPLTGSTEDWSYDFASVGNTVLYQAKHRRLDLFVHGSVPDVQAVPALLNRIGARNAPPPSTQPSGLEQSGQ